MYGDMQAAERDSNVPPAISIYGYGGQIVKVVKVGVANFFRSIDRYWWANTFQLKFVINILQLTFLSSMKIVFVYLA